MFGFIPLDLYSAMLIAATGVEAFKPDYIMRVGERIWNLERVFNVREGFSRKDDVLPERILKETHKKGPIAEKLYPSLDELLDKYYEERGWDKNGIPTREKLEELNLKEVADEMEKI
jgi:aldehyde:ferredoxin oxidoreductase